MSGPLLRAIELLKRDKISKSPVIIIRGGEEKRHWFLAAEALLIQKLNEMLKRGVDVIPIITLKPRRLLFYQERTIWHTARSMNSLTLIFQ